MSLCIQFYLLHILQVAVRDTSVEPDQTLEISEQKVWERKRENVKAILQAYRFTGMLFSDVSVWFSCL